MVHPLATAAFRHYLSPPPSPSRFAFPALLVFDGPLPLAEPPQRLPAAGITADALAVLGPALAASPAHLLRGTSDNPADPLRACPLTELPALLAATPDVPDAVAATLLVADPCALSDAAGWPARNLLALVQRHVVRPATRVRLICYRPADPASCAVFTLCLSPRTGTGVPAAVGWERNARGQPKPRVIDLRDTLDPKRYVRLPTFSAKGHGA